MLMPIVVERDVPDMSVKQKRSQSERSAVLTEDVPADDDSCLKLDLHSLDQTVSPVMQQGVVLAVDSARTLADIPEDYLMTESARTAAADELAAEAGTQLVAAALQPDVAQVPALSVDESYIEDCSSASDSNSHSATSQKPSQMDVLKQSLKSGGVSEDSVKSQDDVSEALSSQDEMSASAVKSAHEALSLSAASDNAALSCKSVGVADITAVKAPSLAAGKCTAMVIPILVSLVSGIGSILLALPLIGIAYIVLITREKLQIH